MKIYKCKIPTGEKGIFSFWEGLFLKKPCLNDICNALAEEIKKWEVILPPPEDPDKEIKIAGINLSWVEFDAGQRQFAVKLKSLLEDVSLGRIEPYVSERDVIENQG